MPNTINPNIDPRLIDWHNINYQEMAQAAITRYRRIKTSGKPVNILIVDSNTGKRTRVKRPL